MVVVVKVRRRSRTKKNKSAQQRMKVANSLVFLVLLVTFYALYFLLLDKSNKAEVLVVLWSSWITCASTGIGVLPFAFIKDFDNKKWIAYGNAIAAGMMMSAAMGLIDEGLQDSENSVARVLFGFFIGLVFIWQSKKIMDSSNAFDQLNSFEKIEFKKFVLVMGVMTLHSLSEGVGIGVSYHSHSLGSFISATLAVHNIPEGLAIAIVTLPGGRFSKRETFLWCIFSSLPQVFSFVIVYKLTKILKKAINGSSFVFICGSVSSIVFNRFRFCVWCHALRGYFRIVSRS